MPSWSRFFKIRKIWSFHVVVWQRMAKKCTKIYNAHAQLLFCSLNLLFGDVPVATAVVVCLLSSLLKALAKEDTLLPTQMFPRLPAHATFVADTKSVSDFVQKHFVSATNVSQFAQPKKHHGQQCVLVYQGLNIREF